MLFTALNNQFWNADMTKLMASLPVTIFKFMMSPYAASSRISARFPLNSLSRIRRGHETPLTISWPLYDTGAAVAAAFHGQPGLRVVVLYPDVRRRRGRRTNWAASATNVAALRGRFVRRLPGQWSSWL